MLTGGGGGSKPALSANAKNDPVSKKNKSKKGGLEIAHSNDPALMKMFERTASHDAKSSGEARNALEALFIFGVSELLALALDKDSPAQTWAVKLLALIGEWIKHYDAKICEASEVYRQEKKELGKFFRHDVWLPTKSPPLYRAIHRELWLCLFYRGRTDFAESSALFVKGKREEDTKGLFAGPEVAEVVSEVFAKVGKITVEASREEQSRFVGKAAPECRSERIRLDLLGWIEREAGKNPAVVPEQISRTV